jgi:hypothetical protein
MRPLLTLMVLLSLPATARADLSLPSEVVPGEQVVVRAEAAVIGAPVWLEAGPGRALGGSVGHDGSARFTMPAAFSGPDGPRRGSASTSASAASPW